NNREKPDVYYIILDAFANSHTLKDLLTGYDNHEFIDFLKSKGFYVVPEAASNYDRTHFSMSSSLNMQHIDGLVRRIGNYGMSYDMLLQDSCTSRLFKRLGYKFVNVSSGATTTDIIPEADINLRCIYWNYMCSVISTLTPIYALEPYC